MISDKFKKIEIPNEQLKKLVEDYLKESNYSKSSIDAKRYALGMFLDYHSKRKIFNFQVEDINKYRRYIERTLLKSSHTVRNYISTLNLFCKYLVEKKILEKNPVSRIIYKVKDYSSEFSFININRIEQILNYSESDIIHLRKVLLFLFYISFNTDLDKLASLKKKNLKLDKRSYKIEGLDDSIDNKYNFLIKTYIKFSKENETDFFFFKQKGSNHSSISARTCREILMLFLKENGFEKKPINTLKHTRVLYYLYKTRSIKKMINKFDLKSESVIKKYTKSINHFRSN